ncbi:MAG: cupin domain-containing protein [Gaiellales bacterium]
MRARDPETLPASEAAGIGATLRRLRKERGLSLSDVAEPSGISASFLSLVENGKNDITIGRLIRLVQFYNVSIADLFPAPSPEDALIVRRDELRRLHSPGEGIDVFLLTGEGQRTMMPMYLEFEPGAGLAEPGRHAGEEWVYVLEGELELVVNENQPRLLRAGDSAYYSAELPHLFRNASPDLPLRLVCVDSPPNL